MTKKVMALLLAILAGMAGLGVAASPAAASGPGLYYAGAQETGISVTGVKAKMRVSNPYRQANTGEHTLMEIIVQDHPGGSPDNAAEFGWFKDGSGAGGPRLFTYYWTGGTGHSCYFGCTAWHDNAGNPIDLGADLTSVASSCVGSSLACVKQFQIEYRASTCGASSSGTFMTYDNTDVGCIDSASLSSTTYDTAQGFAEVAYQGATLPCTDAGNGKYANSGPYSSLSPAVIQSFGYLGTVTTPSLTLFATDINAYTAVANGSIGNTTYSVGGPGYTSTGGTPGNTGSC